jgi:hypothetical protein
MSVGFGIMFIGLLTHRYIEQTPRNGYPQLKKFIFLDVNKRLISLPDFPVIIHLRDERLASSGHRL